MKLQSQAQTQQSRKQSSSVDQHQEQQQKQQQIVHGSAMCSKGQSHAKREAAFICLEKGCARINVICESCWKSDHKQHRVERISKILETTRAAYVECTATLVRSDSWNAISSIERSIKESLVKIQHDAAKALLDFTEQVMTYKEQLKQQSVYLLQQIESKCYAIQRGNAHSVNMENLAEEYALLAQVLQQCPDKQTLLYFLRTPTEFEEPIKAIELVSEDLNNSSRRITRYYDESKNTLDRIMKSVQNVFLVDDMRLFRGGVHCAEEESVSTCSSSSQSSDTTPRKGSELPVTSNSSVVNTATTTTAVSSNQMSTDETSSSVSRFHGSQSLAASLMMQSEEEVQSSSLDIIDWGSDSMSEGSDDVDVEIDVDTEGDVYVEESELERSHRLQVGGKLQLQEQSTQNCQFQVDETDSDLFVQDDSIAEEKRIGRAERLNALIADCPARNRFDAPDPRYSRSFPAKKLQIQIVPELVKYFVLIRQEEDTDTVVAGSSALEMSQVKQVVAAQEVQQAGNLPQLRGPFQTKEGAIEFYKNHLKSIYQQSERTTAQVEMLK